MKEIKIYDTPERVKKFLAKEDDRNKRIEYFMGIPPFSASNILIKDDGVMHYSQSTGKIMMSKNSYYINYYNKRGFTFDGKDLRIWFKHDIQMIDIGDVLKALKINISSKYRPFITKTILRDILKGKISTGVDILKAYFKLSRLPKECVGPYFLLMESNVDNAYSRNYPDKHSLLVARDHAESVYDYIVNYQDWFCEILSSAQILDKKIKFSRDKQELVQLNKELRGIINFNQEVISKNSVNL